MIINITYQKIYEFQHLLFEYHPYMGPVFLRHKDCEPKNQQLRPSRDYGVLNKWEKLSKEEKETFRI
jgi:hypothetical protein